MDRWEMNWKIIRSILPIIALGAFVYYTKSLQPDYTAMDPVFESDVKELVWRFQMNEGADLLYQVVQVNGTVTGFDSLLVILGYRLICAPDSSKSLTPPIGETITVKGRCIGYDDLLDELRLDHVVQIKN